MKKKQEQEITDIREDIPIRRYDKQKKCFQKEDGSYDQSVSDHSKRFGKFRCR